VSVKDKCPLCKASNTKTYAPFCSKRCSDIDLGRWLNGQYSLPGIDGEAMLPANDRDPERDL